MLKEFKSYLVINPGITDNQETWFTECCLNLIGESTRGESACNGIGSSMSGKFQNTTLHGRNENTS
jgi:hypothetical protein